MAIYTVDNTYGDVIVRLNGEDVHQVVYADTDAGYLVRYVMPPELDGDHFKTERMSGTVEVMLGEGAAHVD